MLLNHDNKVWVGRRMDDSPDEPYAAHTAWQMPQGGIDEGEDPTTAAWRELREETGVTSAEIIAEAPDWFTYDFPPEAMTNPIGMKFRGQRQKWFALRFKGSEDEVDISAPDGQDQEFDDWRWVAMRELPNLIVPFKRDVYLQVVEAFAHIDA